MRLAAQFGPRASRRLFLGDGWHPGREDGEWELMRVHDKDAGAGIQPLPDADFGYPAIAGSGASCCTPYLASVSRKTRRFQALLM